MLLNAPRSTEFGYNIFTQLLGSRPLGLDLSVNFRMSRVLW